jgi:hypothetical protein
MTSYAVAQAFIVALVVAWSAWYAARRLLPTASRRAQAGIAAWFERRNHAAWLRRIGRWLRPLRAASGGCGTTGCSTCGACGLARTSVRVAPSGAAVDGTRPLAFRERAKS